MSGKGRLPAITFLVPPADVKYIRNIRDAMWRLEEVYDKFSTTVRTANCCVACDRQGSPQWTGYMLSSFTPVLIKYIFFSFFFLLFFSFFFSFSVLTSVSLAIHLDVVPE